jgi:hypothetical protein
MTERMATPEEAAKVFAGVDHMLGSLHEHLVEITTQGRLTPQQFQHATMAMVISDGLRRLFQAEAARQLVAPPKKAS